MLAQFKSKEFLVFLATGGFAAVVNFGSRIVYDRWLSFSVSIVLAYITGMITAFVLMRILVFTRSAQPAGTSAMRFVVVNLLAVLQTWIISMVLAYYALPWLGVTSHVTEIAHAVGVAVPAFTSYLLHKYWTFASADERLAL